MTGTSGSAPGMPSVGGALGGDWNAPGNVAPVTPHWPARNPTWIRVNGAEKRTPHTNGSGQRCKGFLTLLQGRKRASGVPVKIVALTDGLGDSGESLTLETSSPAGHNTMYLLGS